jgi:hypothetical protein
LGIFKRWPPKNIKKIFFLFLKKKKNKEGLGKKGGNFKKQLLGGGTPKNLFFQNPGVFWGGIPKSFQTL